MSTFRRLIGLPDFVLDGWRNRWPRIERLAGWTFAFAFASYLVWPILGSDWDLIDDHGIVASLNASEHHGPRWFIRQLLDCELGAPGGGPRYRPAYFFLRLIEVWVFGPHPHVWYFARLVMCAIAIGLLLSVLRRALSLFENLCFVGWLATFVWWSDIWGRLGPAETYAVVGLPLYAYGVIRGLEAVRADETRASPYLYSGLALFIGGSVCVGSKENLLFLVVPTIYVIARARFRSPRRWLSIAAVAHLAVSFFIGIAVVIGVHRFGHVYAEDVSAQGRFRILQRWAPIVWTDSKRFVLAGSALAVVAIVVQLLRKRRKAASAIAWDAGEVLLVLLFLGGVYIAQVAFYNGNWPPAVGQYCCSRYNFPGMIVPAFALYAGYWFVVRTLRHSGVPSSLIALGRIAAIYVVAAMVLSTGFPIRKNLASLVQRRRAFGENMKAIVQNAKSHPGVPIIFVANGLEDYEPVVSVQQFLKAYHVSSTVFLYLRTPPPAAFPPNTFQFEIAKTLVALSQNGVEPLIKPWSYDGGPCLAVGFHGGIGPLHCTLVGSFY